MISAKSSYLQVGLVYVFNLIIGTGALALPRAFSDAGWALGLLLLTVSCFIRFVNAILNFFFSCKLDCFCSYINATFVIECMACANAVLMSKRMHTVKALAIAVNDV